MNQVLEVLATFGMIAGELVLPFGTLLIAHGMHRFGFASQVKRVRVAGGQEEEEYVPTDLMAAVAGDGKWYAIPLAALIAVPLYMRAETALPVGFALMDRLRTTPTAEGVARQRPSSSAISRAASRAGRPTPMRVAEAGPVQSP
ncbi:hypothetical protein ACODT5_34205 [Streptomyces sp. 5.8]|uniref:hypothetical protein n=1 Tax=Streptomyces sp. 5.8 TaxID=3406571 RepID=UPI003BB4E129